MQSIKNQPTEKEIYIWNITGSMANALLSVIALMLVTRMLNKEDTDIFSIAWSISQLMVTIGTFQIRVYQATDVKQTFQFKQYCVFRFLTVVAMLISSAVYIRMCGYVDYKAQIVMIVCVYRAVDSIADVYEGWFQQKERLDLAGKALTYRIVFSSIVFGVILVNTHNLLYACWSLVIIYVICFFAFDVSYQKRVAALRLSGNLGKNVKWIVTLSREGLPLFVNAFIIMSIMNTPKMVIDTAIQDGRIEQGAQTVFNILFMPASVLSLAYIVFRPLITQMAIVWGDKKYREFIKILGRILLCLFGMAIVLIIGSAIWGIPVLSVIYGMNLDKYKSQLLLIIVGGCCYTFAAVLDNALVVIRKQYLLIISYIVSWIYRKVVAEPFVNKWKLFGASMGYTTAMLIFLVVTAMIFVICFYMETHKERGKKSEKIQ